MGITSNRFCLILLLISFQWCFSQEPTVSKKDIQSKINEASLALSDLDADKSLHLSQKALAEANAINDNVLIAKAYNVIATNFLEFSDSKEAIVYYNKALYHANLTDNDTIKDWILNNLGNAYTYKDIDFDKGIDYYKQGLVYTEKTKNPIQITYNALNISGAYFDREEFDKGYPFLVKASKYIGLHDEIEARITLFSQLGGYYSHLKQNEKAEENFKRAISFGEHEKTDLLDSYLAEVYNDFSKHYFKNKNYELAYHYLQLYHVLEDKIYNLERSKNASSYENKIQIDEFKRQISNIEQEKEQKTKSLQKTQIIVFLFVIIFLILLLLLYSLFKNNNTKKQSNKALQFANYELQIAKDKAEESTRLKSQFVSTISHELRTPLYGVVGITDIIADEHPEIKNSPYLKSLKFSAQYLLSLVNDILQVYKISEKKIVLINSVFNLKEELNAILGSLQFLAFKNNNEICLEFDEDIPKCINSDKVRLSQIFMNLISNSLKFTEEGNVIIKANLMEKKDNACVIHFEVIDNGIGISKEDHEKIFEQFVQIERRDDDYQGTGLGLPIVKKLIQLLGGEIQLESEEKKGTKISFDIRFEIVEETVNPISNEQDTLSKPSKKLHVLLVEDNKINQVVTQKILDGFGYVTTIVNGGYDAVAILKEQKFDIILMDINMPKINGFETSILIRGLEITTPIIALTAFDKQEIMGQIKNSSMNGIIVKPFEPRVLNALIIELVG
ncbi:ATP-binding protein [Flavobacterium humi]|uniref:histidine kinase n=1 Tax=Flavobacterium humi TaxID=2562683 RepID=A0A4Z0LCJ1_9FLAO|nr:ATP-binding protein [Flavobacterium humi]TGD59588.1 response regulator [Flavobacterium humi]